VSKEEKNNKTNTTGDQSHKKEGSSVSTNIEKILIKATMDEKFKETLLNDRKSIMEEGEFSLNNLDKMILTNISLERLENMINNFSKQYTSRRNFLKGAAASVALISGSLIASSCCIPACTGARPEPPLLPEKISPEGNTVDYSYSGLKIIIPPGAVDKSVNISISVIIPPAMAPKGMTLFGEVYNISGDTGEFKKEISIVFPYSGKKEGIKAYSYENSSWKEIPLTFEEKEPERYTPVVKTKKFGIYTLGNKINVPTPTPSGGTIGATVQ
jgi:hypothetical protein